MQRSIRLFGLAGLIAALKAGAQAGSAPPPVFHYPPLLLSAGIEGTVRFRVQIDSVGSPQLATFQIVSTPNAAFNYAVQTGLGAWRDSSIAGRLLEHAVRFVIMDTGATDSIARCRSMIDWTVCVRRVPPTVLHD